MQESEFGRYGIQPVDEWCSLILVRVYPDGRLPNFRIEESETEETSLPIGYVFVVEYQHHDPKYKLPGGHKLPNESAFETAIRELEEETGIQAPFDRFEYMAKWKRRGRRGRYWDLLFVASITESERDRMNRNHPENDGELPKFFTVTEFQQLVREGRFMEKHFSMLNQQALVLFV